MAKVHNLQASKLRKLVEKGLSTREIAQSLSCSQTNIRYWLRKFDLRTKQARKETHVACAICSQKLTGKQTKYCSNGCKSKGVDHGYPAQKRRGQKRKNKLIELAGGACEVCGYDNNSAALAFHHKDPDEKEFSINSRKCSTVNWDALVKEASKCLLVCHNCHMEIHYPHLNKG